VNPLPLCVHERRRDARFAFPLTDGYDKLSNTKGPHVRGERLTSHSGRAHRERTSLFCCSSTAGARYVQDEYHYPSPTRPEAIFHAQFERGAGGATGTGRHPRPIIAHCSHLPRCPMRCFGLSQSSGRNDCRCRRRRARLHRCVTSSSIRAWLNDHPTYSLGPPADCQCDDDIKLPSTGRWRGMGSGNLPMRPYAAVGDFDGDGVDKDLGSCPADPAHSPDQFCRGLVGLEEWPRPRDSSDT